MNQLTAVEILLIEDNPAEMTQHTLKEGPPRQPCSSATTATQSRRSRTNGNGLGDFGEITRAYVAVVRSQQSTCQSSDALTRGMFGIV